MQTVVHVTHEAIQKIGGIGAVLEGLLTSRVYLDKVPRNVLIGPFWPQDVKGEQRLGPQGEVLYSSLDSLYRSPLAARSCRNSRSSRSASRRSSGSSGRR